MLVVRMWGSLLRLYSGVLLVDETSMDAGTVMQPCCLRRERQGVGDDPRPHERVSGQVL